MRMVAEPDLYVAGANAELAREALRGARGRSFHRFDRSFGLGVVSRAGQKLAIAERADLTAQRRLGDADMEQISKPLAWVDQPPARHVVDNWDRPVLDGLHQRRLVHGIQSCWLPTRFAIDQA